MTTKAQRKQEVAELVASVAEQLQDTIDQQVVVEDNGKLFKLNTKGEMLLCELTLHKREGAPDPQCITINEEFRWVKRGHKVVVPWYVVEHLKLNIERKFHQEKDPTTGKSIVVSEEVPAETFSYKPIDPAPGVEI
jgi:hypothetical protein